MNDADFERAMLAAMNDLRSYARKMTRNPADADDLTQDALLRAWKARAVFDGGNMRAWLTVIARNCFFTSVRSKRATISLSDLDMDHAGAPAGADAVVDLHDVLNAMALLPAGPASYVCDFAVGESYADIALAAGIPEGTVKSAISRARQTLAHAVM